MKIAKRCVCCDSLRLAARPAVLMPFIANRVFGWEPVTIDASWGMRDLPQGVAQSVCRTLMCEDCGLVFLDMRFDDEEMAALYDDYRGPAYTAARDRFEPGYAARNELFEDGAHYGAMAEAFLTPLLPARPRVLDWGGDSGVNTPFRGRAAQHDVYDISGRPVVEGARAVDHAAAIAKPYDLIACCHVIEHVAHPVDILREIVAAMRPETLLYVEAPHEDLMRLTADPAARLAAKRHWHEHINFFSGESVEALLNRIGLDVVARDTHPIHAGGKTTYVFSVAARKVA